MSSFDSTSDVLARAELLLDARRPSDAIALVQRLLVTEPDNQAARLVVIRCQLALGRIGDAERGWARATATQPEDPQTALVGVQCAAFQSDDLLWQRAQRYHTLAPDDPVALFFVAVGAGRMAQLDRAESAIARLRDIDPASPLAQYAVAEVDLCDALRTRRRRARRAEQAAKDLLAQDPLDAYAHDIRVRGGELRRRRTVRHRTAAMSQLELLRQGAVAGRPLQPGSIRRLALVAASPLILVLVAVQCAYLGYRLIIDFSATWAIAALPVVGSVLFLAVPTVRWVWHSTNRLPRVDRAAILRPVVRSYAASGTIAVGAGVVVLAVVFPFSDERAMEVFGNNDESMELLRYFVAAGTHMVLTGAFLLICMLQLHRRGRM